MKIEVARKPDGSPLFKVIYYEDRIVLFDEKIKMVGYYSIYTNSTHYPNGCVFSLGNALIMML